MSLSSKIMEGLVEHLQNPASFSAQFPEFPAKGAAQGNTPTVDRIMLKDWLNLPIDRRAPKRSVAMVDIRDGQFTAVVIDTVADLPRFWIQEPLASIALLYEGMSGAPGESLERGTVILAAIPSRPPPTMRSLAHPQ
jgi:hypothetical protein